MRTMIRNTYSVASVALNGLMWSLVPICPLFMVYVLVGIQWGVVSAIAAYVVVACITKYIVDRGGDELLWH